MIRGNKLENFIDRVLIENKPITADVFLTDFCNNRCEYCRYCNSTGEYMSYNDFETCLYALKNIGVMGVILTGGGEPTINPDFEKITNLLKNTRTQFGINTNLNKKLSAGANFIKVSIDCGDKTTYKKIRGVDSFELVLENLNYLIDDNAKKGEPTQIGLQCVTDTVQQTLDFYRFFKKFNVSYLQFRPIETKHQNKDYSDILMLLKDLNKKDNRVLISPKYQIIEKFDKCVANWSVLTVKHNLDVIYCCHKPDEIVTKVTDKHLLEKLKAHNTNMCDCETPCRLSAANRFLKNFQEEKDLFFV